MTLREKLIETQDPNTHEYSLEEELSKLRILNPQIPLQQINLFLNVINVQDVKKATAFNLHNCEMKMFDLVYHLNISNSRSIRTLFNDRVEFHYVINNGQLTKKTKMKTSSFKYKKFIGTISEEHLKEFSGRKIINMARFGQFYPIINTPFDNKLTPEQLSRIFPYITPDIKKESLLVSINPYDGITYSIDGIIGEIKRH